MCSQVAPLWISHLHLIGTNINGLYRKSAGVCLGYGRKKCLQISEIAGDVLGLLDRHGGPTARRSIRRYIPTYESEVVGSEVLRKHKPVAIRQYTLI